MAILILDQTGFQPKVVKKDKEGLFTEAIRKTMFGAETEVKATQRLPYLGIHAINSQQTLTLLWMTRSVYQMEHAMVFSGGALPEPYKYRADASTQLLEWAWGPQWWSWRMVQRS